MHAVATHAMTLPCHDNSCMAVLLVCMLTLQTPDACSVLCLCLQEVYDRVSNYVQEGEASKAKWYKALLRAEEGLKDYDRRFLMDDGQPNSWILPYVQQRDQALAAELPTIKQGMANLRQEVEGQMAAVMRDHKELEGRVQAMEALARDRKQRLASAWQEMRSSMDSASMDGTGQAEA